MDHDEQQENEYSDLRARAEEAVRSLSVPDQGPSSVLPDQLGNIIHELKVHQAELEIQNEELRRAQLEVGESRDRYADLYDFAPVGYLTLDRHGVILEANLSAGALVNREKGSLIGKPFAVLVVGDNQSTFCLHLRRVFEAQVRQDCELKLRSLRGGHVHVRMESIAVQSDEGEPTTCRTAVSDITEIKLTQEVALRTREQVLSSMAEGVVVCDQKGTISFSNAAFDTMFGYEPLEVLGKTVLQLDGQCKPEEGEPGTRLLEVLDETVAETHWRGEILGCRKDGTLFDAFVRLTAMELFGQLSLIAIWEDITALRRAEKALRDSERRFRAIFESATDLIFLKDSSFHYTHVNPAFEKLLGKSAARLIGLEYEDLFGQEGAAYENDVDVRVLEGEAIEEQYTRTINGTTMRFHEVRIPLRDHGGNIVGLCGIARDITERRERELEPRPGSAMPRSNVMKATVQLALRGARKASVVLLQGESGSGKDYLARFIHDHSDRPGGPYFSINCAAVPPELAESELFGHERGSFTGAHARKRGLLELAEGGTLLLNEIGDLTLPLQAKLLTFLDTKKFTRVGGEREISVNARLIAATNRDLAKEVEAGRFREDLYYRLGVMVIHIPPLRERLDDLPQLVEDLAKRLAGELQLSQVPAIDVATLRSFTQYHWPGNIRELRNVLERALLLGNLPTVDARSPDRAPAGGDFPVTVRFAPGRTLRDLTDEVTRTVCIEALRRAHGNKKEAARLLGIARDSLYRHVKNFGIELEDSTE